MKIGHVKRLKQHRNNKPSGGGSHRRKENMNNKKFVRYQEGAKMYSMGLTKFQELAKEAKACYKIGQLVLVNTEILDEYLERFRITDEEFYK